MTRLELAAALLLAAARRKARRARRSGLGYCVTVPISDVERLADALEAQAPGAIDEIAERLAAAIDGQR